MTVPSFFQASWWALPVLVGLSLALYWPDLDLTAFSDDHSAVWNSGVRDIPWRNGMFRPIGDLTFRIGHLISGTSSTGHRVFNVCLHAVNAFALFMLLLRILSRGDRPFFGAFLGATLFLVYPFHQESIIWLVGRESALGTFFVLIGLLALSSGRSARYRIITTSLALLIGLLCYEGALVLPLLALVLSTFNAGSKRTPFSSLLMGYGTAVLLYLLALRMNGGAIMGSYAAGLFFEGLSDFFSNAPKVWMRLFLPPEPDPGAMLLKAGVILTMITLVALLFRRSVQTDPVVGRTTLTLLWLLIVAGLFPMIVGVSARTSESDRFLYLPSAFLCALVASLMARIPRTAFRLGLSVLVSMLFLGYLQLELGQWRTASAITARILEELPEPPARGTLFVTGLPDSYKGAYIFRNGFREAVAIHGGPAERYIDLKGDPPFADPVRYRGDDHRITRYDRWVRWNGRSFDGMDPR
ncbi:MAG: hypothetical protein KDC00_02140 [Flavobacteriales bacterium]|nr:hypothetical protein [Flavobacteriales bacterium]